MIIHLTIHKLGGAHIACGVLETEPYCTVSIRSMVTCQDCLDTPTYVTTLTHLAALAKLKRCCFNRDIRRHQPASWLINLSGHQLHQLFIYRTLTEYHKK